VDRSRPRAEPWTHLQKTLNWRNIAGLQAKLPKHHMNINSPNWRQALDWSSERASKYWYTRSTLKGRNHLKTQVHHGRPPFKRLIRHTVKAKRKQRLMASSRRLTYRQK
jgi:hypothetical protein